MSVDFTEPNVSDTPTASAVTFDEAHAAGFLGHTFDANDDSEYTFAGAAARVDTGGATTASAPASSSSHKSSKDSASK